MAKIDKRRRREGKTDYSKRMKVLKGETPRIIFRRTNKYIIAQFVESNEAQDKVVFGVNSSVLLNYGWPKNAIGSLKSVTASYLLGILMGKSIKSKKSPIIDFGMARNIHKSRAYAFLKGLIDSGIKITHKEGIFPEENRINGEHLKNKVPFQEIKSKIMEKK